MQTLRHLQLTVVLIWPTQPVFRSTMTINPPTPASLDAILNGLVAWPAFAFQAAALQNQSSSKREIEVMRADILTALIGAGNKFRDGLKVGEDYGLAGAAVASNAVYTLKQFIAGKVENKDIQDIARSLDEPIAELLKYTNEMHEHWSLLSTELENVQYKTEEFQRRVQQVVKEAEEALQRARTTRDVSMFATVFLAIVSVALPPVAGLAAAAATTAGMSEQRVVDELKLIPPWKAFGNNLETIRGVVKQAQGATTAQIRFWSDTRVQIKLLEKSNALVIKNGSNGWMNNKLLEDWTGAEDKFKELVHKTSDCRRFLEAHPDQFPH
ncbi:hypothetical protein B0H14DRAFT_3020813 [Mycena olivaceomarginata]|nr:hypothetical protein B0H14DRAFT_3020813 [Mycena olivaceomarginata]